MKGTVEDRFWPKVDKTESCWIWRASETGKGYGGFWDGQRFARAHRVAFELFRGPIPDGMTLDHLCRNRRCVNPAHLEPVTAAENIRRGFRDRGYHEPSPRPLASRAYRRLDGRCRNGHVVDDVGLYPQIVPNGRVSPKCRGCMRASAARFRDNHRAERRIADAAYKARRKTARLQVTA